eukprot:TRINITY_DN1031_c0_g1_i3.p1 TRINITY_DN1031_c0_g1~~TRINITY_DN1031_c0_g1_i3.p1  ORF type:complete len:233 (-),score=44.40 TRINITY_DN1031_c0_g1_i3:10-708(-)
MFLECHKADCFAMDLADAAAERLVEIKKNVNLGYPCCKGKGEKNPAAVGSGVDTVSCDDLPTPVLTLGESTTPFQFIWSHGHESVVADSPLHEKLLVALHGSFSTWQNVSLLAFPWVNGQSSEDEAVELLAGAFGKTGWAYANEGGGRVAGLAFHPDGRLFIGDDVSGEIWWFAPKSLTKPNTSSGQTTTAMSQETSTASPADGEEDSSARLFLSLSTILLSTAMLFAEVSM